MTLVRTFFLTCNRCLASGPVGASAKEARARSRKEGWRRIPRSGSGGRSGQGRDLCRKCGPLEP